MEHTTLARWASRLDPDHPPGGGRHRAQRAIEIAMLTGRPLTWWQRTAAVQGTIKPWIVRLTVPRQVLHQRIRRRVEEMIERGLLGEVAAVIADGAPLEGPGMDGIGVREAVAVLQGTLPSALLVDAIATSTRQYAKRQETWLRHQMGEDIMTLDATRPPEQLAATIAAAWERASA
jgi:tRNA dimethylallyltransferase